MRKASDYRSRRAGAWRLRVLPEHWSDDLQEKVLALIAAQMPSKHPQTIEVDAPAARNGEKFYLKIFHDGGPLSGIKDIFRPSKAFRFWRQGVGACLGRVQCSGNYRRRRSTVLSDCSTELCSDRKSRRPAAAGIFGGPAKHA